jgi:uncharacterized protein (TIGR00730 family)
MSPTPRLSIAAFCGARDAVPAAHLTLAREFGEALAGRGHLLVYGAGREGLMGALADGALARGGQVVGVAPHDLFEEALHPGISKLELTRDMAERKTRIFAQSNAVVGLAGGIGTLDEWFEALTLRSLGRFSGPVALLDRDGFFAPLMDWLARLRADGYIRAGVLESVIVEHEPGALLDRLESSAHA